MTVSGIKRVERLRIPRDGVTERLARLFKVGAVPSAEEKEVEARISSIAREFLRTVDTSTDVDIAYLAGISKRTKIPDEPSEVLAYIDYLAENVVQHSIRTSSPRFIGHMTSALPYFVRPLGKLVAALNQNAVKVETAKSVTPYERQGLAMVHRLIFDFSDGFYDRHVQRPDSTLGMIVSGGTAANGAALWCARNSAFRAKEGFRGVAVEGLQAALTFYGYKSAVIIASPLVHYSIGKAADLLGIGSHGVVRAPLDRRGRIDLGGLRETIARCRAEQQYIIAVIGIAGATDSGAVDPLAKMAAIARESNTHFHVDAAWGGPVLFSRRHRHKLAGIEQADSVTIDGHKQLYLPMGIGMALFRDPELAEVVEKHARYIARPGSLDIGKRSLEGSRPAMAIFLHAALSIIGNKGYEVLIDEGIRKASYMASSISARPEFELLTNPEINIVNYRFLPKRWRGANVQLSDNDTGAINDFNVRLQKRQRDRGRSFVSRTVLERATHGDSVVALRAVLANPLTTEDDIEAVLTDQILIAEEICC